MMSGGAVTINKQADKQVGISLLRILATLLVLGFHAVTILDGRKETFGTTAEQLVYVAAIRHMMNWHVPVFFMISGALLLDRDRKLTPAICMKRYALRMLLALAVFGIPYACMSLVFETRSFSLGMIWQAILNTVNGDNWDHMWFLYTMTGVYLFLPLLKRFTDNADRKEKVYILLLLLVYDFCIPTVDSLVGTHIGFAAPVTYPIFYVLLGDFCSREAIPAWLRDKRVCTGSLCLIAAITALVNIYVPQLDSLFSSGTSPVIVLAGG